MVSRKFAEIAPIEVIVPMLSLFAASHFSALTPEQVVNELRYLPSAPKVLPHLKRLLSDSNSSIQDIVTLIRFDPGTGVVTPPLWIRVALQPAVLVQRLAIRHQ